MLNQAILYINSMETYQKMYKHEIKKYPMSDTTIKSLKHDPSFKSAQDIADGKIDGGTLYLRLTPEGGKQWRIRYKNPDNLKWQIAGLGSYPEVTGSAAREAARTFMQKINNGEVNAKRSKHSLTFEAVAKKWIEDQKVASNWSNDNAKKTAERLANHIYPKMRNRPINRIKPQEWLDLFLEIYQKKNVKGDFMIETANRVRTHCRNIYDYAIVHDIATRNPINKIENHLKKNHPSSNLAHVSEYELPDLLKAIANIDNDIVRLYLQILSRTFLRPNELTQAKWCEFDFENKIWEIPANRMKKRRTHIVPLSSSVINLLTELKTWTGVSPYLFPSRATLNKPCTTQRFRNYLKKLGYHGEQTLHGFRHIASTKLNDFTDENGYKFDERVIEFALAHQVSGVRGVYNKAQYLEDRRKLMDFYSNWIDKLEKS